MKLTTKQRFNLIRRNTQEIVSEAELSTLLQRKKPPVVYLGTAITGRPHIGYYVWVLKLADFLRAGCSVKLLLADLHGALDNTPWEVLEKRYFYYAKAIPLMFTSIGVDISRLQIIRGSSYQLSKEYVLDLFKLSTLVPVHDAQRAGSEVVKYGDNPKLGGVLYPLMQALDEEYLGVDIQYGGVDQRKIFMFARENLPKLGYKSRVEVMTPLVPGLIGKKMSASDSSSKIDLLDDEKTVQEKVRKAYCEEGVLEDNGILAFLKYVLMVLKQDHQESFNIERPHKFGGNLQFTSYQQIEALFIKKQLHPLDIKNAVAREINVLLAPFREHQAKLGKLALSAYS